MNRWKIFILTASVAVTVGKGIAIRPLIQVQLVDVSRDCGLRHVEATLAVDSLDEFASLLRASGVDVPDAFHCTPVGRNMTVRHADGLVVEYFEPARSAGA